MKKTLNIVRLENGKYVTCWTPRFGEASDTVLLDVSGTTNIFEATPVIFTHFKKFFEPLKATYLTVEFNAKIV